MSLALPFGSNGAITIEKGFLNMRKELFIQFEQVLSFGKRSVAWRYFEKFELQGLW